MRVIAGSAKKRQLKAPKGSKVRPTADRVKEALFNILGPSVAKSRFLDLFAGTGSIGIEALSRGADEVVFVELGPPNTRIIQENLSLTGLENKARLLCMQVDEALSLLGREKQAYDLIFMDPPYLKDLISNTLVSVIKNGLLKPDGLLIAESSKKDIGHQNNVVALQLLRQSQYGNTVLSFYQH